MTHFLVTSYIYSLSILNVKLCPLFENMLIHNPLLVDQGQWLNEAHFIINKSKVMTHFIMTKPHHLPPFL